MSGTTVGLGWGKPSDVAGCPLGQERSDLGVGCGDTHPLGVWALLTVYSPRDTWK